MGKYDYLKSYERQIESIVVAITTIYCLTELILGYTNSWNPVGQLAVLAGLLLMGIYFFGKYNNYETRAHITCFVSQVVIVVYGIECGDFYKILSLFISLCILLGLYGVTKALIYPFLSYNLLVFYYIFIAKQLNWGIYDTDIGMITRIFQGYLTLFLVIYLVYRYKSSQENMMEMIDALRKSEREKDDFLANVSHEIRTPINTICGISEIMLKNDVPVEIKEDMLSIQSAGRNLMSVVGDILDYSELQDGKFEILQENYYIGSMIYDVINMAMAKKSEKKLEFIIDCATDMPSILIGDEQKIRRVIMNLVNNAVEFTSEGCVSIYFGYRKEEYGINLIITVKDTGIGMSKENVENLFKKFSQADMGRTRKKGGIGLGLAIAQTIVNRMGGFITVKSELGKGSEFKIVIPQKVFDVTPVVDLPDRTDINAAVYINMEQFRYNEIRDEYGENIQSLVQQLKIKCHICRNLQELKRWNEREEFNHIFISLLEYQEDTTYFDRLAKRKNVHIILDHYDDAKVQNENISKIYKPFFALSIVATLKNTLVKNEDEDGEIDDHQMYAPEAHILVIDDNRMNIRVVEGLLRTYGIKVSYALSGQEGIDMLASKAYDLILLDHMMPGMDGVETFHHIRKRTDAYYKEIPIIALTANAIAGAREMFIKEGFNDFIAKPVESSVLQRTLKRHLPEHKLESLKETEPVIVESKLDEELVIGDLDISKGIMYCGSKENYLEILTSQRDSGKEIIGQVKQLYEKADWKNYVILVHGIKSSMMSIGAVKLSEMAKGLEFAGKADDIEYIRREHDTMLQEFERVMQMLFACKYLEAPEQENVTVNKPEISEEMFTEKIFLLENVTYEFDSNKVIPVLDELSKYTYHSKDLAKELKPVYKKVEMFDFMSAYETVVKIKEKE